MAESEEKKYRVITRSELKQILAQHKKWLETGGKDGEQANLMKADLSWYSYANKDLVFYEADLKKAYLSDANFQGTYLMRANLQGAYLWRTDLSGALLVEANLKGAHLYLADFNGADLLGAILRAADLSNANFTGAKSLLAEQLAGLDLTGATLPADIHNFTGPLKVVEDASKHARYIFFAMQLACVYAVLTVATHAPDLSDPIRLPVLNIDIPVIWFYRVAPVLLLMLYQYFLFYMQRLWEKVADLPAVFPDGYSLDRKVYPWLLTEIIHAHVPKLREKDPPRMFGRQRLFSVSFAWCAVPATLLFIIYKSWAADDILSPTIQIIPTIFAVAIGFESYLATAKTLAGNKGWTFRHEVAVSVRRTLTWLQTAVRNFFDGLWHMVDFAKYFIR